MGSSGASTEAGENIPVVVGHRPHFGEIALRWPVREGVQRPFMTPETFGFRERQEVVRPGVAWDWISVEDCTRIIPPERFPVKLANLFFQPGPSLGSDARYPGPRGGCNSGAHGNQDQ